MAEQSETNRLRGYMLNQRINDYLAANVANYRATQWDDAVRLSGSTYYVDKTNGAKDSIIAAQLTAEASDPAHSFTLTKHASNPLIIKPVLGTLSEFYRPNVIKDGSSWYVLAKNTNEGWYSTSLDGITWAEPVKCLTLGANGTFDDNKAAPSLVFKEGSTYYCYYSANDGSNADSVGWATSSDFITWTKQSASAILNVNTYNAIYGTSMTYVYLHDCIKVGSNYYWFGSYFNVDSTINHAAYGVSTSLSSPVLNIKLWDSRDVVYSEVRAFSSSVFKHPVTGKFCMALVVGQDESAAMTQKQCIIMGYSQSTTAPTNFVFKKVPILEGTTAGTYDNGFVYAPTWLKSLDGTLEVIGGTTYYMYYAAHSYNPATYTGVMCLATTTSIPQV